MEQENISFKIKELRKNNNLTQSQLGEKLGVTFQAVSKWENGINIPDIAILNQMSLLFNIDINELINGEKRDTVTTFKLNKIYLSVILVIIITLTSLTIYNINNKLDNNMKLTTITTSSLDFELSGSLVMNNNAAVIHISNINYIGEKKNEVYQQLNFQLIENNNNSLEIIDEVIVTENKLILEDIVSKISFRVENYVSDCKTFSCNSLYIRVTAIDSNGKTINFDIPFISIENCTCKS